MPKISGTEMQGSNEAYQIQGSSYYSALPPPSSLLPPPLTSSLLMLRSAFLTLALSSPMR